MAAIVGRTTSVVQFSWDGGPWVKVLGDTRAKALAIAGASYEFRYAKMTGKCLRISIEGGEIILHNPGNHDFVAIDEDDPDDEAAWKMWGEAVRRKTTITTLSMDVSGERDATDELEDFDGWKALKPFESLPCLTEATFGGDVPMPFTMFHSFISKSPKLEALTLKVSELHGLGGRERALLNMFAGHPLKKCLVCLDCLIKPEAMFTDASQGLACSKFLMGLSKASHLTSLTLRGGLNHFWVVTDLAWEHLLQPNITFLWLDHVLLKPMEIIASHRESKLKDLVFGMHQSHLSLMYHAQDIVDKTLGGGDDKLGAVDTISALLRHRKISGLEQAMKSFLSTTTNLKHLYLRCFDEGFPAGVNKALLSNRSLESVSCLICKRNGWMDSSKRLFLANTRTFPQQNLHLYEIILRDYARDDFLSTHVTRGCIYDYSREISDPATDAFCAINRLREDWEKFGNDPEKHFESFLKVSGNLNALFQLTQEKSPEYLNSPSVLHHAANRFIQEKEQLADKKRKRKRRAFKDHVKNLKKIGSATRAILDDPSTTEREMEDAFENADKQIKLSLTQAKKKWMAASEQPTEPDYGSPPHPGPDNARYYRSCNGLYETPPWELFPQQLLNNISGELLKQLRAQHEETQRPL